MAGFDNITIDTLTQLGATDDQANHILNGIRDVASIDDPTRRWMLLSQTFLPQHVLSPDIPFPIHELLFRANYESWDTQQGPPPAWVPIAEEIPWTNLGRLMAKYGIQSVSEFAQWSCDNRPEFWKEMVESLWIYFDTPYSDIVDLSQGVEEPRWLPGAKLNIAESCFSIDDAGPAIRYRDHTGKDGEINLFELRVLSNRVANGLRDAGFQKGDGIGLLLPMTVEAVAAYLGIILAGCYAVSIADSFAPREIQRRLQIGQAKAVLTQDVVLRGDKRLPLYDKLREFDAPRAIVVPATNERLSLRDGDCYWDDFISDNAEFQSVICHPHDVTNVLFSSGTTGDPKAIPWTHTTPIKAASDAYLYQDVQPGDVVTWPTNMGWMMGPWLIYASLINHGTIALYYGHPGGRDFCRFIQDAGVNVFGLIPSLVAAWRSTNATDGCDWRGVKCFSSTGECSNPSDMLWLMSRAGYRPVIEYCGGTELGGGYITGTLCQPASPSTFTTAAFSTRISLRDEQGQESNRGEVYLEGPSIGFSTELLNRDHHEVYFAGTPTAETGVPLRRHGDAMERLPNGYYRAMGRVDDTMNLGGIKVSAVEIEAVLNEHKQVTECAAIAVEDETGGPAKLVVYVVARAGEMVDVGAMRGELQALIKERLNPLFKVHEVMLIETLPRTASNKVMRRELRGMKK